MLGEIYALATALIRGFSAIPTKKGLNHSNPNTSVLISLIVNVISLWCISFLLYPLDQLVKKGLEYFIIAGVFAPGVARIFRDTGFQRLGVAITYPIISSNTFFSMMIAVTFLGEKVTSYLALGAILIFFGVIILARQNETLHRFNIKELYLPSAAALLFACSVNFRKIGLQKMGYPLIGAATTLTVSLIVLLIYFSFMRLSRKEEVFIFNWDSMKFFIVSGLGSGLAFIFYFMALSSSYIVKIQPISATNPLFAILFSHLFLRDEEKITVNIVLGSVIIISGITLLFI